MKKVTAIAILICLSVSLHGQDHPILVSSQWLKDHLNDPKLVVLQVNYLKLDYDREHIAGARYLWPEWLAPNSPEGSYNVPKADAASAVLQKFGISNDSHVVLCYVRNEVSV